MQHSSQAFGAHVCRIAGFLCERLACSGGPRAEASDMTQALIAVAAIGCPAAMGVLMWFLLRSWRRSDEDREQDMPGRNEPGEDH
jgi:hypothetical protein